MSASKEDNLLLHCVRCHETFNDADNSDKACTIEHDTELFVGSRNGMSSWYTGYLTCCGADYKFHRYYSKDKADPAYCFQGKHTTDPNDVDYTIAEDPKDSTIIPCGESCKCSESIKASVKATAKEQLKERKRQIAKAKAEQLEERKRKKARIEELKAEGKTREARHLRADMLGYDDFDGLNSDESSNSCDEFDCASDSSLIIK
jgi:hypothetical protein